MKYRYFLLFIGLLGGFFLPTDGCCFSLCLTKKQRIAHMVDEMSAGHIVVHQRNNTEDYKKYHFAEDDVHYLQACITKRLQSDADLNKQVEEIIKRSDEQRRLSMVMMAQKIHTDRTKKKRLNANRLPSAVAAQGLVANYIISPRGEPTKIVIGPARTLVTREKEEKTDET